MAFYVLDENNNKVEALDKEGVLAAIEQAIADGSLAGLVADAAFITKLKCCVSGTTYKIAFTTQAYYNELVAAGTVEENTYYYIIDDTSAEEIDQALKDINNTINGINKRVGALETKTLLEKEFIIDTTSTKPIFIVPKGQVIGSAATGKITALLEIYNDTTLLASKTAYIYAPTFLNIASTKNITTGERNIFLIKGGAYAEFLEETIYSQLTGGSSSYSNLICKVTFKCEENFKIYEF